MACKCKLSPFLVVLFICLGLGIVLIVVPIFSFRVQHYVRKEPFLTDLQIGIPQLDYYDTLVFQATDKTGCSIHVFKEGYEKKLNATTHDLAQIKVIKAKLEKGDAAVIPFHFLPKTFVDIHVTADDGAELEFNYCDYANYSSYKSPSKKIVTESNEKESVSGGFMNVALEKNFTYNDTFGTGYSILVNKGKPVHITYNLMATTPVFNITESDAIAYCVNESSCKLQRLPRKFFALAFIHVEANSQHQNFITISEQYRDWVRWTFPSVIYGLLFLTVVVTAVIQLIVNARRKKSPTSYSTIQDPLNDQPIN